MGWTGMTTALGSAVLFYLVLSGRLAKAVVDEKRRVIGRSVPEEAAVRGERRRREKSERKRRARRKMKWPERAPVSWGEAARVAARTVKFTYRETLGRWHLGEIAFGIKYYMKQQGDLQHEFAASDSSRLLGGPEVRAELIDLLTYLRFCMSFSNSPYEDFLDFAGLSQDDVIIRKRKGRVLKPSFTIVRYGISRCFLLFIRGAISVRDRLTAATGSEVSLRHVVVQDGCAPNVVEGYAHCGMLVAARWIAMQAIPALTSALDHFPDYEIKIIGHSMGASIASILTVLLRENNRLASTTCIAYAPAACMTYELAESTSGFITTLINKNDLVPSLSRVSTENLRKEVMASSWIPDLREQIQRRRFLSFINSSVSFFRSNLPFVSNPTSKVSDADIPMQSTASEAEMKQPADPKFSAVKKPRPLACLFCAAPHEQIIECAEYPGQEDACGNAAENPNKTDDDEDPDKTAIEDFVAGLIVDSVNSPNHHCETDHGDDREGDEVSAMNGTDDNLFHSTAEYRPGPPGSSQEAQHLYPPGRLMHMLVLPAPAPVDEGDDSTREEFVGIYRTQRELYGKIRLSPSMIQEHYMLTYLETVELLIDQLAATEPSESP